MNLLQFYTLSSLNLDVERNISKTLLNPTIMLLKYIGQHVPYLAASCQMNCSIPIWCHMCMEARSTSNRCCRNALDRDIGGKVICDSKHPKYHCKVTSALPGCCSTAKKVLCYFPGGKKRFGRKVWGEVSEDVWELENMRSDRRDYDTFRRASLWIEQIGQRMSCCSASSCMKISFLNTVKNIKFRRNLRYRRNIKYRAYPNHKEWWSLGSFMRAKVFCRIIIVFCTYCSVFRVEQKPPHTTQQTLPAFRLGLRQSVLCIVLGLCLTFMVLCLSLWAETQFAPSPLLSPLLLTWHLKLLKL